MAALIYGMSMALGVDVRAFISLKMFPMRIIDAYVPYGSIRMRVGRVVLVAHSYK